MEKPEFGKVDEESTHKENGKGVHGEADLSEPSQTQKNYIFGYARSLSLNLDLTKIKDKEEAFKVIRKLRTLRGKADWQSFEMELHGKREAFQLATKLVHNLYLEIGRGGVGHPSFWKDVRKFYQQLEENQVKEILEAGAMNG